MDMEATYSGEEMHIEFRARGTADEFGDVDLNCVEVVALKILDIAVDFETLSNPLKSRIMEFKDEVEFSEC